MTLVGRLVEEDCKIGLLSSSEAKQHLVSMMLSVQPPPLAPVASTHQHYHHHLTPSSPPVNISPVAAAHRGNVIVTVSNQASNLTATDASTTSSASHKQPTKAQQKRKMYSQATPYSGSSGTTGHQPASVARRNARERNRVKQVNNGFATLRQHIPQSLAQAVSTGGNSPSSPNGAAGNNSNNNNNNTSNNRGGSKKLSKVETLRMAVEYIRNLKLLLDEHDAEMSSGSSPISSIGSPSAKSNSGSSLGSSSIISDMEHHQHQQQVELKFEFKSERCDDDAQDLVHHQRHHDPHNHNQHHHHHHHHQHQVQQQHHHQIGQQQQQQQQLHSHRQSSPVYIPAPNSEASSSPTPSFISEASSAGGSQGYGTSNFTSSIYATPTDGYDSYEPMSPEDEELLDYITLWQQGQ